MTLVERLRRALASPAEAALTADDYQYPGEHVPAAVLIAVTDRPEPGVILTVRQESMRRHAGQIAFPGGRIDPQDESPSAAALREAWEEIALNPAEVELVGASDTYLTGSGYRIEPIVGVIPPDLPLHLHEAEVAALFEVPLAFLTNEANHKRRWREMDGRIRHYHEIQWQERRIWGITAGLIINLSRRLAGRHEAA